MKCSSRLEKICFAQHVSHQIVRYFGLGGSGSWLCSEIQAYEEVPA